MSDILIRIDRDDAACLAPILRGRIEEIEQTSRLRAGAMSDFDLASIAATPTASAIASTRSRKPRDRAWSADNG